MKHALICVAIVPAMIGVLVLAVVIATAGLIADEM